MILPSRKVVRSVLGISDKRLEQREALSPLCLAASHSFDYLETTKVAHKFHDKVIKFGTKTEKVPTSPQLFRVVCSCFIMILLHLHFHPLSQVCRQRGIKIKRNNCNKSFRLLFVFLLLASFSTRLR